MISLFVFIYDENIIISLIKEYRGPNFRPPCNVIDDEVTMKNTFWHNLGQSFHI